MSYSKEFVEFVAGQMSEAGTVTYRLMFGAYSLYLDGKLFGIVGNDQVFIKQTEAGKEIIPGIKSEPPYEGAKDYFLLEELDDKDILGRFIRATVDELPEPKKKKK